ncbi:LFG2 protein, partial [Erithacus rubecula]|nr:LFG2 protein [Erithacus rubecula]
QLSVNSKPPSSEGQGDKKGNATAPPAPPSYEEATAGERMKSGNFPAPPAAPLHPSWAYVDPSKSFQEGKGAHPPNSPSWPCVPYHKNSKKPIYLRSNNLVYTLLILDLSLSCSEPIKGYIQTHPAWYWASYAVFFITYLILACCSGPSKTHPACLISIFSPLIRGILVIPAHYYNTKSVLLCLGITALVCLSVTIFSFQSK